MNESYSAVQPDENQPIPTPTLPFEIWSIILWYPWEELRDDVWGDFPQFLGLIHSNRLLYSVGMTFLYRQCVLNSTECARRCLTTIVENDLAASSVRHLAIRIAIDFDDKGSGEIKPSIEQLLSQAMERLPNLTSFHFVPYLGQYGMSKAVYCSEHIADSIFVSPERFPFRLTTFVTSLAHTSLLSNFLTSQTSLRCLQLETPAFLEEAKDNIPSFPSLTSIALTGCYVLGDLEDALLFWLPPLSTIRHLVLDLEFRDVMWGFDKDVSALKDISVLKDLTALSVRGEWERGLGALLGPITAFTPNLTYLSISIVETHSLRFIVGALPVFNSLPNLNTVVYDMTIEEEDLEKWLSTKPNLPKGLHLYARFWNFASMDSRERNVHVYYDHCEDKWLYRLDNDKKFPVMDGICCDERTSHDPEKILNAAIYTWI